MFFLLKTALMLPLIPIIALNNIFNISIAENFPKTNIELPNYTFNDIYDSFVTNLPNYYNIDWELNTYTSIVNDTNGYQLVSFDFPGFSKHDINITVNQNLLSINGSINKCMDSSQFVNDPSSECKLYTNRHFIKTIDLPIGINTNHISALINDGLVTIMYPLPVKPPPININIQ